MKILACDIGSTNLKLQVFSFDAYGQPVPESDAQFIHHAQSWLHHERPLEALEDWLTDVLGTITDDYANDVDAMGFSTFREGLIGLSKNGHIVFAGNNLRPEPLGTLADSTRVTTLAGWLCWRLTGRCCVTAGQRDAGKAYAKRVSPDTPIQLKVIAAGENMQSKPGASCRVFLGGTDEQLGYVGTGLLDDRGPQIVIATGTFWSTSHIASGAVRAKVRRTHGVKPFRTVDSCVLYKWGPMIERLSQNEYNEAASELVASRYFGKASARWFTDRRPTPEIYHTAVDDLRQARLTLTADTNIHCVVYGGGVKSDFARRLITEACDGISLTFMEGDATLRGCAIIGKEMYDEN